MSYPRPTSMRAARVAYERYRATARAREAMYLEPRELVVPDERERWASVAGAVLDEAIAEAEAAGERVIARVRALRRGTN